MQAVPQETPSREEQEQVIDIETLTYEQARTELGETVVKLERGGVSLEESMTLWQRGEQLAAHCQTKLDNARATLEAASGTASATP